ncbi:MAG: hypothetical protein MJZ19_00040 [Paludibacteraceae bacterium]|nr:hypothetical protein [Paludibacteraceae bacterium]
MNKIVTHFLTLITMLCLSVSAVFAQNQIEGDYLSDMKASITSFMGNSKIDIEKQATKVTKISDGIYDVNFGSLDLGTSTVKIKFKNLVFDGTTLSYGEDSYVDGVKDATNAEFTAKLNENNQLIGSTSFTYSGMIKVAIDFTMTPYSGEENTENKLIKELTFKSVPYYNTINNQNKTKDEFAALKVSVYKDFVNVTSDEYIVKLGESNNLTAKVALALNNLKYTANEDTTIITILNSETKINFKEYSISANAVVNATFNAELDSLDGNFSYVLGGDKSMLDILSGGTIFNITCNFGKDVKNIEIVDEQFDFDFENATHFFAKVSDDANTSFEHAYLSADAKTLALYPVKLTGVSQKLAVTFEVDTTHINIFDEKNGINFTNIAVKANGNAKQYIQSLGIFAAFGNEEGEISAILSADEQFVGQVAIGGNKVSAIDVKAPVVVSPGEMLYIYHPICGYKLANYIKPVVIDSVDGVLDIELANILFDNEKNPTSVPSPMNIKIQDEHLNSTDFDVSLSLDKCRCYYPSRDTTIEYKFSAEDNPIAIDATKDIENAIRELIGEADCYYTVEIPEEAKTCKLGETLFNIKVGEFESNITVRLLLASSVNNVENNASSISYSNGVLSVSGYDAENIELFSIIGTKVLSVPMAEKTNISLAKGVYLVKVGNATEKVVVK